MTDGGGDRPADGSVAATRRVEAAAWRVEVPVSMTGGAVGPPPELTSMAILRGEIAPGCPAVVIAGARPRAGRSLRAEARRLGAAFAADTGDAGHAGDAGEGRPWRVEGARDARRIDGLIEMEEGLTDDAVERAAVVVAATPDRFVTLTVRTRPADDVAGEVEAVVRSFRVLGGGGG